MLTSLFRTMILYFLAMFAVRIMGKRQIGELQPSDLVITMLISELATLPMQDFDIPLILGIIPIATLIFFEHIISFLCLKNVKFRRLINGNPCIVISNGKIDVKILRELRISVDELLESLRANNVTKIEDVQYAIIETNGQLSCVLFPYARAVDASSLNIKVEENSLPLIVVNDGYIIERNLQLLGKTKQWLMHDVIHKKKLNLDNIFLMTMDINKNLFIQQKDA